MKNISQLKEELEETKTRLSRAQEERRALQKAIWDILNYANMFVVLLDSNMNVRLANWSLATALGFETEKEIIGKCWLDFIRDEEKEMIRNIHRTIASSKNKDEKYKEVVNEIINIKGKPIMVKWFNIQINGKYNMTFSFGIQKEIPMDVTEDGVRSYFRDITDKDTTMINAMKEAVIGG